MSRLAKKFELQKKSWAKLRQIHPSVIDLAKIQRIRDQKPESLRDPDALASLILELGLNDDGLDDFPEFLRPYCGNGLRIWQYPHEFSRYLAHVLRLGVRSYIELGTRHGGTFVTTVECIARCCNLEFALGIDIMPCPSMAEYTVINPKAEFFQVNTQSEKFARVIEERGPFDAAFIDANHDEEECRHELEVLKNHCNMVAFHDIANTEFPAVGQVWHDVKQLGEYRCYEYISDYAEPHIPMGIGLAVRTN